MPHGQGGPDSPEARYGRADVVLAFNAESLAVGWGFAFKIKGDVFCAKNATWGSKHGKYVVLTDPERSAVVLAREQSTAQVRADFGFEYMACLIGQP